MSDASVRLLDRSELPAAVRLVLVQMLGHLTDAAVEGWAELWGDKPTHGAFAADDLVGVAQWFPTRLSMPGEPVPAAAVTAVGVLSSHRRQGHLTRMMHEQLRHATDAGNAVAVLIAAEQPIYGRFGYGNATEMIGFTVDTVGIDFRDGPVGTVEVVDLPTLRPALQAMHEASWARVPGAILREDGYADGFWDRAARVVPWPDRPLEAAFARGAIWRDPVGEVGGALLYTVEERWTDSGRPDGTATVDLLVGSSPEAERELWRHLCTLDWVRTVKASHRPVDDPLPLWLTDGRAVTTGAREDHLWLRVLDLPAAVGARRSEVPGEAVLEVVDPLGYAEGRWRVEIGPDGASVTPTTADADVRLPVGSLGAALLGGHTLGRLARAGRVEESRPGGLARAGALLATPTLPWSPLEF